MKYSISDIANLLGISIVSVRNYEKSGLIEPDRNEQNNYRQYNAIDLNLIRRARSYMSYGFSLNEAVKLLQNEDLLGMAQELRKKEKDIELQMMRDYQKFLFTKQHAAYLERIAVSERECAIEMSPTFYGILYRENTEIFQDKDLQHQVSKWNDIRPFAETLMFFKQASLENEENKYQSGLCMEEQYADLFHITEDKYVKKYPARKTVHTMIRSTYEPDKDRNEFEFQYLIKWIRSRNLTIVGDAVGRILHTSKSSGQWLHHVELWVPIE